MMEWVNVKERLPEKDCICLVTNISRPFNFYVCSFSAYFKTFEVYLIGHSRLVDPITFEASHYAILRMPDDGMD